MCFCVVWTGLVDRQKFFLFVHSDQTVCECVVWNGNYTHNILSPSIYRHNCCCRELETKTSTDPTDHGGD